MPYKSKESKRAYDAARFQANLRIMREYKVQAGCADCGYREHHAGLEFDHIGEKKHNVSALLNRTTTAMFEEISKCEVVCGTCHNIRSFERKNTDPTLIELGRDISVVGDNRPKEHGLGLTGRKGCYCELCAPLKRKYSREYAAKKRAAAKQNERGV